MKLAVVDIKGKETSKKVDLSKEIYEVEPNDHAIYLDVKQHLANKRQGTHKAKERGEVKGSRRKLRKQKGTGAARVGDIKNPIFRGGGRAFGPRPKSYNFKLNKKLKRLARKSALTYKAKDKAILVLEDFNFEAPKTKQYSELLTNLKVNDKKTLLVLPESDKNVYLSSRNLKGTKVVTAEALNTYDIMNAGNILMVESSVKKVEETLSK